MNVHMLSSAATKLSLVPRTYLFIKSKKTDGRGYGVETSCDITKDQAIIEVTGGIVFEWKVSPCLLN